MKRRKFVYFALRVNAYTIKQWLNVRNLGLFQFVKCIKKKHSLLYPQVKFILFMQSASNCHCYYNKERKWYCDTCTGLCKQKNEISSILTTLEPLTEVQSELDYSTVSTLPIPVILDEKLIAVYNQQLSNGFELPLQILPEACYCDNGYPFNTSECLKLEQTGIFVYTETDVLELKEHKSK